MERRPSPWKIPAVVVVVLAVLAGCAEGDPGADGDVESLGGLVPSPVAAELTELGRCADGRLWAADDDGSVAVTVETLTDVDEAVLPSDDVEVVVLHGDDLTSDGCPEGSAPATSPAAQGRVEVDRDDAGCAQGFRIDGLEAEDGTTFAPIAGDVDGGC